MLVAGLLLAGCEQQATDFRQPQAPAAGEGSARARSAQAQRLERIVEQYYDHHLELNPLQATAEGDHRYDDRLGDYLSERWLADSLWYEQVALERLVRIYEQESEWEKAIAVMDQLVSVSEQGGGPVVAHYY